MAFSSFDIVTLRKCRYSLMQIFFCLWCIFFFSLVGNLKGVFFILEEMALSSLLAYEISTKTKTFFKACDIDGKIFRWHGTRENVKVFFSLFSLVFFLIFFFLRTPKRFRSPVISQTLSFRDSELDACVTNNDSSWNQLDILNVCRKLSTYLPHTKND